jgi:outer membrane protein TolC
MTSTRTYQPFRFGGRPILGITLLVCLAGQGEFGLGQGPPQAKHEVPPPAAAPEALPPPHPVVDGADSPFPCGTELLPIDLPTALQLVNGNNPTIQLARLRTDEAYARIRQAQVAWLPNLDLAPSYYRHDGELQNSMGLVFGTSKSNVAVTGGPVFDVDTSVGLFAPLIARQLARAQTAETQATINDTQLRVALAYLDLLQAYGQLAVNRDILARDEEVLRRAEAAQQAELSKTGADINRARTEYQLRLQERITLKGQVRVASARLARLLLLKPTVALEPAEPSVVPVTLVPDDACIDDLVAKALQYRPEVIRSQSYVDAGRTRWKQSRLRPLLPHLQVAYTAGGFGGGQDSDINNFKGRGDGTAQAVWQLDNLGFGNKAANRIRGIEIDEAVAQVVEVKAEVAEEVTEAAQIARARLEALASGQEAIRQAVEMFRKLDLISFGMNGPNKQLDSVEPLLAVQALAQARFQYLNEVVDYNRAQFQLYRALGSPPAEALGQGCVVPVSVSPTPPPFPGGVPGAK